MPSRLFNILLNGHFLFANKKMVPTFILHNDNILINPWKHNLLNQIREKHKEYNWDFSIQFQQTLKVMSFQQLFSFLLFIIMRSCTNVVNKIVRRIES